MISGMEVSTPFLETVNNITSESADVGNGRMVQVINYTWTNDDGFGGNATPATNHSLSGVSSTTTVVEAALSAVDVLHSSTLMARYLGILLISFFCFATNLMTFIAILTTPRLQTPTGAIILSLAVADMLFAMLMTDYVVYSFISPDPCKLSLFKSIIHVPERLPIYASNFHMILVAGDRFVAIVYPLRYRTIVTPPIVGAFLAGAWLLSVASAASLYSGFTDPTSGCIRTDTNLKYKIATGLYIVVASMLVTLYTKILVVARRQREEIRRYNATLPSNTLTLTNALRTATASAATATVDLTTGNASTKEVSIMRSTRNRKSAKEQRGAEMISVLIGAYIAFWFPYIIGCFGTIFGYFRPLAANLIAVGAMVGIGFSAVNIIIYAVMSKDFANTFRKFARCGRNPTVAPPGLE